MAGNKSQEVPNLSSIKSIDVLSDGKSNGSIEDSLKALLKQDLQTLWNRKNEWRKEIDKDEYERYRKKAEEIFRKRNASVEMTATEYKKERLAILKHSGTFLENLSLSMSDFAEESGNKTTKLWKFIRNVSTDAIVIKEQLLSDNTLSWYTDEIGNYTISVKDFEAKLQTHDLNTINTKEISSYLYYLHSKWQLTGQKLRQKFGEKNIIKFMNIWSHKIKSAYNLGDGGKKENDITLTKEVVNFFIGKEVEVEKVLAKIFREELGNDNIQAAQTIYNNVKKSHHSFSRKVTAETIESDRQYQIFLNKAYAAIGGDKNEKDFKKKFEHLLKTGFSSYDAIFELLGGNWEKIHDFQALMGDIAQMEKKKAQDIDLEIQKNLVQNSSQNVQNFCSLPEDKQLEIATREKNLPLLILLKEKQKAWKDSEHARTLSLNTIATVTSLENKKNGKSQEQINKSLDVSTQVMHKESKINIVTIQWIPGLEKITHISQVWRNPKKVEILTQYLQNKDQPTAEEKDILECILLKNLQFREFIIAKQNITESHYDELQKSGKIQDFVFADNIFDVIKPDMTLAQFDKKIDINIQNIIPGTIENKAQLSNLDHKEQTIFTKLTTLPENEKIPLQEIGNETCFVVKSGDKYILSINKKVDIVCSKDEIESTINSYSFLHEIGLGPIGSDMNKFLSTIESMNALCPKLDIKKGFFEWQKRTLLKVVDTIFDLDMHNVMMEENTESAYMDTIQKLNNNIQIKWSFDQQLRVRWILTSQGDFNQKWLKQILIHTKI